MRSKKNTTRNCVKKNKTCKTNYVINNNVNYTKL